MRVPSFDAIYGVFDGIHGSFDRIQGSLHKTQGSFVESRALSIEYWAFLIEWSGATQQVQPSHQRSVLLSSLRSLRLWFF